MMCLRNPINPSTAHLDISLCELCESIERNASKYEGALEVSDSDEEAQAVEDHQVASTRGQDYTLFVHKII